VSEPQATGGRLNITVDPGSVHSDGKSKVTVRVEVSDINGKPLRGEPTVSMSCRRAGVKEEKKLVKGVATFKFAPVRPTGKTRIKVTTPVGKGYASVVIRPTPKQEFWDIAKSFLVAFILVMFLIRPFVVEVFYIPSGSMEPTLYQDDRLLANKFVYRFRDPRRGDIVIFQAPNSETKMHIPLGLHRTFEYAMYRDFIKRVVAVGGDTIEVRGGHTYVNGRSLAEPFIKAPPNYVMPPVKVPKGKYFVMGDNRNNSYDSHFWGPIGKDKIIAKAMFIFWPLQFDRKKTL
jgi:signal peptidase I